MGAERARAAGVPLLGLNLGHVGFLAEAEENELSEVARAVVDRAYRVEERLAIDVRVTRADGTVTQSWALNEASVEKGPDTRMMEFLVSIDGHPLSRWGADGLVLATPTGSTAYAWSAGGPVVWPDVEALLVVPLSAHALFARPLVLSPTCVVDVELSERRRQDAVVWCDGRRRLTLGTGDSLRVNRSARPVPLARLHSPAFVARLVNKFHLPVEGWRGPHSPPLDPNAPGVVR
ncbi:MAG: kinase [Actinomycetota bacterium]|nr:kinase [Actinomycetota bacterium]